MAVRLIHDPHSFPHTETGQRQRSTTSNPTTAAHLYSHIHDMQGAACAPCHVDDSHSSQRRHAAINTHNTGILGKYEVGNAGRERQKERLPHRNQPHGDVNNSTTTGPNEFKLIKKKFSMLKILLIKKVALQCSQSTW